MKDYTPNSIRTFTGKYLDLLHPDPEEIDISDIMHGLAHTPRFAGQLPGFYTVAQHSIAVADLVWIKDKGQAFPALMHDASEAYMGDMPKPFKVLMPDFVKLEDNLMMAICHKFRMESPMSSIIKEHDGIMLHREMDWFHHGQYPEIRVQSYLEVVNDFINRFHKYSTFYYGEQFNKEFQNRILYGKPHKP